MRALDLLYGLITLTILMGMWDCWTVRAVLQHVYEFTDFNVHFVCMYELRRLIQLALLPAR